MKKFSILTLTVTLLALGSLLLLGKQADVLQVVREKCKKWGVNQKWVDSFQFRKADPAFKPDALINCSNLEVLPALQTVEPGAQQAENQQQATALITSAELRLKEYHAVKAQLQQVIFMNGMKYHGQGEYLQSGDKRLKLSVHMQAGASTGDLLQVSDGQLLWTEYRRGPIPPDLPEDQLHHYFRVERRNLGRIEERLKQLDNEAQAQQIWDLGAGGISALLSSFRKNLDFTLIEPQSVQGLACYVLEGRLNHHSTQTANYLKRKREYVAAGSVPFKVVLYLEQAQLFPLRYEYYRQHETEGESPLLQVELSQVIFNGAPDLRAFTYSPPQGYFPHDVTRDFLERIKTTTADASQQTTQ